LYPYLIGASIKLWGSPLSVKYFQAIASTATSFLLFLLAGDGYGRREGLTAAGLHAFYPTLAWFPVTYWSETVFILLLVGGIFFFVRGTMTSGRRGAISFAFSGLFLALAVLTREAWVLFPLVLAVALALHIFGKAKKVLHICFFLLVFTFVLLPWLVRTRIEVGHWVGVTTNKCINLLTTPESRQDRKTFANYFSREDEIARERDVCSQAVGRIHQAPLSWISSKVNYGLPNLWNPDSFLLRHLKLGRYGEPPAGLTWIAICAISATIVYIVFGVGLLGIFTRKKSIIGRVSSLLATYTTLVHILAQTMSRYRLPVMAVWCAPAAAGLIDLIRGRAWALSTARRAGLIILLIVFAIVQIMWFRHHSFGEG